MTDPPLPPPSQHVVSPELMPAYREIQMAFRRFAGAQDSAPIADLVNKFSIELFTELKRNGFMNDLQEHDVKMAGQIARRGEVMSQALLGDRSIIPEYRLGFQKAIEMMTGYLTGERL